MPLIGCDQFSLTVIWRLFFFFLLKHLYVSTIAGSRAICRGILKIHRFYSLGNVEM